MRALMLCFGIFILVAAGGFIPLGQSLAKLVPGFSPPDVLPYIMCAVGAALVMESTTRFADK
jgi:hypothetical protein